MKRLLSFFPEGTVGYGIPTEGAMRVAPNGKITPIGAVSLQFVKNGADIIVARCSRGTSPVACMFDR